MTQNNFSRGSKLLLLSSSRPCPLVGQVSLASLWEATFTLRSNCRPSFKSTKYQGIVQPISFPSQATSERQRVLQLAPNTLRAPPLKVNLSFTKLTLCHKSLPTSTYLWISTYTYFQYLVSSQIELKHLRLPHYNNNDSAQVQTNRPSHFFKRH